MSKSENADVAVVEELSLQQLQKVDSFVKKYAISVARTASAIIELAKVIYDASENLSKIEYKEFLKEIRCDDESKKSYLKKMTCIAKDERLLSLVDVLPASYTTLYSLSSLKDDQLEMLKSENILSPDMTAKEIAYVKEPKTSDVLKFDCHHTTKSVTLTFDIENKPDSTVKKLVSEVFEICRELDIYVEQHRKQSPYTFRESKEKISKSKSNYLKKLSELTTKIVASEVSELHPA